MEEFEFKIGVPSINGEKIRKVTWLYYTSDPDNDEGCYIVETDYETFRFEYYTDEAIEYVSKIWKLYFPQNMFRSKF